MPKDTTSEFEIAKRLLDILYEFCYNHDIAIYAVIKEGDSDSRVLFNEQDLHDLVREDLGG